MVIVDSQVDVTSNVESSQRSQQNMANVKTRSAENRHIANPTPRTYTIDLSLPPSMRYTEVIEDFKHLVPELKLLFDELLSGIKPQCFPLWLCHIILRAFLRRTYSKEQNAELQGFSKGFGLPVYILVAYNVLLDLLMGCTSGGVLIKGAEPRMYHFRTLDWGMPALRNAVVQYDYVQKPGEKVIVSTIGYVGFVGVLTGVKQGLSISLNFRPCHNAHGWTRSNLCYYYHVAMVLVGRRPSIASHLRDILLPETPNSLGGILDINDHAGPSGKTKVDKTTLLFNLKIALDQLSTTAAYIISCNGNETAVIEKDLRSSKMTRSSTFITTTNHDISDESDNCARSNTKQLFLGVGMEDLIAESVDRKRCLMERWEAHVRRQKRKQARSRGGAEDTEQGIRLQDLKRWILKYSICNEQTHFVCIMDPVKGVMKWVRCFEEGEISGDYNSDDNEPMIS